MFFSKLSMLKKILLSTLPVLIGAFWVSSIVEKMSSKQDEELTRAISMVNRVNEAELAMVKMSESLRGYLLMPSNDGEYQRKKQADEEYSSHAEQLAKLCTDDSEIIELNEKMAKYDQTDLDRVENEVADLIKKKDPTALDFYIKTYLPARQFQSTNFSKLKDLVLKRSQLIVDKMQENKKSEARMTIALLLLSVFFGVAVTIFTTKSVVQKAQLIAASISGNVAEVDTVAGQMSDSSQRLSSSTTEQASSLQETAASLQEMTSMVARASDSAKQSALSASETQEKAQTGREAMNTMLTAIDDINNGNLEIIEQVKQSNAQMTEVVNVITLIGNKTRVINEIVFQTKLLSFNASVEAARAGEHGKGFAVVAEEVGNLAQMSGNAAKEISDMLNDSTSKVQEIVRNSQSRVQILMDTAQNKLNHGVSVAKQCSDNFEEIVSSISRVTSLAREISEATQEQAAGINEISKAMNQLDSATQIISSTSEESAAGSQVLAKQTENLRLSTGSLVQALMGTSSEVEAENNRSSTSPFKASHKKAFSKSA